ncbi:MAG TPA: hypothetical protein VJJ51_07245 [Candidatus Methanoperedens sp.]|nr:hypothetical protein [Candidatus Methanoperedens sp.]HLB70825.1 hypothetical protein [Candidatus Methanoperedens sp.]
MEIHKDEQETYTLVVSRDELMEIKDALGLRCLYFEALHRKKAAIARSKAVADDSGTIQNDKRFVEDKIRNMYIQITKGLE